MLIYSISDDECHSFQGNLAAFNHQIRIKMLGDKTAGVRGILDDLLRRIQPQDTVVLTSDHGFVELLPILHTCNTNRGDESGRRPQNSEVAARRRLCAPRAAIGRTRVSPWWAGVDERGPPLVQTGGCTGFSAVWSWGGVSC